MKDRFDSTVTSGENLGCCNKLALPIPEVLGPPPPHSLQLTTATLLLEVNVDIRKVQELLGHRHVTTTQIYDKRWRTTKESASHDVPI